MRALIGERAEFVAYVNCVMDRTTLDTALDAKPGERWVQARPGHLFPVPWLSCVSELWVLHIDKLDAWVPWLVQLEDSFGGFLSGCPRCTHPVGAPTF